MTNLQLKYKRVCITGTLNLMTRDEAFKEIEKAGGYNDKSITASTSYLVIGDKPGAVKVAQAKKRSIRTLTEKELIDMIYDKPSLFLAQAPEKQTVSSNIHFESRDW